MIGIPQGYRIEETLWEEEAVASYRAVDPQNRIVVLKVIQADQEWAGRAASWLGRVAAVRHPGLAAIFDYGQFEGGFYVARDWIPGHPVDPLSQPTPRDPWLVRDDLTRAADAVGALHAAGLAHGNLRPSNLIRTDDGRIIVVDAGISREPQTAAGAPPGGAVYLTPEQVQGQPYTARSDVYALGTILYLSLTGRLPFDGADAATVAQAHVARPAPRPSSVHPGIPYQLDEITERAMAKAPDQRYIDANQMAGALRAVPAPAPVAAEPAAGGGFPVWGWLLLAAAVIVAIIVAVLVWPSGDTATAVVPDVVGMTATEAETALVDAGFELGDVTTDEASDQPPGTVTEQNPAAGEEADEGSAVDLTVAGIAQAEVPDVVGASESEAIARLADAGLRLGEVTRTYDANTDPGFVLDQTPAAGESVEVGTAVNLTISLGEETGAVPNVVGLTQQEAVNVLQGAGFQARTTSVENDAAAGSVVAQSPEAGAEVSAGTEVEIQVSLGPPPEEPPVVPDVTGQGVLDARDLLRDEGLVVEIEWREGQEPYLAVVDQDPAAGTTVDPGSTVILGIGLPQGQTPPDIPTETT